MNKCLFSPELVQVLDHFSPQSVSSPKLIKTKTRPLQSRGRVDSTATDISNFEKKNKKKNLILILHGRVNHYPRVSCFFFGPRQHKTFRSRYNLCSISCYSEVNYID